MKNFVLDTNVLIHDPTSIYQFDEHAVMIPLKVLEEIDRFKKELSERISSQPLSTPSLRRY